MQNRNRLFILIYIVPLLLGFWACGSDEPDEDIFFNGDEYMNIMQYIDENPEYSSFAQIVRSASMTDVLSSYNHHGGGGYTLFLPDNMGVQAFLDQNADYNNLESLLSDSAYARSIVRYHTVNAEIFSYEFPNGGLADKNLSYYFLTVVFRESGDSIVYAINDEAAVTEANNVLSNGIVHTIGKMLTPVVYTTYDLLKKDSEYSIFTEMLEKVGLVDTLNSFTYDPEIDRNVFNQFTTFTESNSLYAESGITSFDDLAQSISPDNADYLSDDNPLNIYAKYHILTKSYFLDEFYTSVFNTYTQFPISVDLDLDLKFNVGTQVFDTLYADGDTSLVNYLLVNLDKSNLNSKSGAIHQLDRMLYPFSPKLKKVEFDFYEESKIFQLKDITGEYTFEDEDLDFIQLEGIETIDYVRQDAKISIRANQTDIDKDYIVFSGNAQFLYTIPKVLPGKYTLQLLCKRRESKNASIQTYVDGVRVGGVEDLTTAEVSTPQYYYIDLGIVRFDDYKTHVIKIETVIPGTVNLAKIVLKP